MKIQTYLLRKDLQKGFDDKMEKKDFNEYLVDISTNRLRGIVECLIDVGRDLDGINCDTLEGKKRIIRTVDELIFCSNEK